MSHQKWNPKQFALRARVYPRPPVLRHRQHHQIRLTSWCLSVEVSMLHNSRIIGLLTSLPAHHTPALYAVKRRLRMRMRGKGRATLQLAREPFPSLEGGRLKDQIKETFREG